MKAITLFFLFFFLACSSTKPFYGLKEDAYKYIMTESNGGKLDFGKSLNSDQLYVVGNIAYNAKEEAVLEWGAAVKLLGIEKDADAVSLYEEIKHVKLAPNLIKALKAGFNYSK